MRWLFYFTMSILVVGGALQIYAETSVVTVTVIIPECNDTLDNDGDTFVDYPSDPGCTSLFDNDETDPVAPQCNDGIDNDGDSRIDFPTDLGCDSLTDNDESGEVVVTPTTTPGGGNGPILPTVTLTGTQVIFSGRAFPGASITALADGKVVGVTRVGVDNLFRLSIEEIPPGVYIFNIYATDPLGRTLRPQSFALELSRGLITEIKGIVFTLSSEIDKITGCSNLGDLNADCKVNLTDFSIAAYWWGRTLDADFLKLEARRLSGDGKISLEDFSILAYYWTG